MLERNASTIMPAGGRIKPCTDLFQLSHSLLGVVASKCDGHIGSGAFRKLPSIYYCTPYHASSDWLKLNVSDTPSLADDIHDLPKVLEILADRLKPGQLAE